MYIVPKIEVREAEDIVDFATTMDSDMNLYFKEKNELLEDVPNRKNDCGAVFYPAVINPRLFHAYILKRQCFRDDTCRWNLCISCREDKDCYMVLETMRGTEEEAKERLSIILTSGSIR